jgi:hypothetical protein
VFIVPIDKRWTSFKTKGKDGSRATDVINELFNREYCTSIIFYLLAADNSLVQGFNYYIVAQCLRPDKKQHLLHTAKFIIPL